MKIFKKLIYLASVSMVLAGCSTVVSSSNYALSKAIEKDSDRLNEAYNKATNGVILKNILRARDRVPTNFTTLSGIQSTPQITNTNALGLNPIGLGNPSGPFQASTDTVTNQVQSRNQYNINPFAGGGGRTESLLFDISEDTFERYWNGWPKDVVFLMFIETVSVGDGDAKPCQNEGNEFDEFMRCLGGKISVDSDQIKFDEMYFDLPFKRKDRLKKLAVENKQLCSRQKIDLKEFSSVKSNLETLEKLISTSEFQLRLVGVDSKMVGDTEEVKPVFDLCRDVDETGKIFTYGKPSDGTSMELKVTYRSFDDIIYYLGESMRFSSATDAMRPKVKDACRPGEKNESKVPLVKVHRDTQPGNNYLKLPNAKYAVSVNHAGKNYNACLLYTSPSPRDLSTSRMPSSA